MYCVYLGRGVSRFNLMLFKGICDIQFYGTVFVCASEIIIFLWCHLVAKIGKTFMIIHFCLGGRRPQFRLLAKYIHKTVRTDTDRARCDWLLLMIKY